MTDIAKKIKNTIQGTEAKAKTEEDHAKGKPSSETLNKAKIKELVCLSFRRIFNAFYVISDCGTVISFLFTRSI